MSFLDSLIARKDKRGMTSFKVLINGFPVQGLVSILVHKEVNKISTANLVIIDGEVSKQDFEASSSGKFNPGKEVTIRLGYSEDDEQVFSGIIVSHGVKASAKKGTALVLELKDKAVQMTLERKNKYFTETTDSSIIESIMGLAGMKGTVDSTTAHPEKGPRIVQYYTTDWDFILSRAEVNGLLVYVDDGLLNIKKPEIAAPKLTLDFSSDVVDFEADLDARDQYSSVESTAWDPSTQDFANGSGSSSIEQGGMEESILTGVFSTAYKMQHTGMISDSELESWASAKLLRSKLAKIQGRVKIKGFKGIKPGDTIELKNFGEQFNGRVFVSEVRHEFTATSAWYTDIRFGLCQEWFSHKYPDINDTCAAGLLPGIKGLHIGLVKKVSGDPDKQHRVQVTVPMISKNEDGLWARIATLDAGPGRGSVFRPKVNDEVILGFLNDDPRDPIILGMLFSSVNEPAEKVKKDEDAEKIKGLFTANGMKFMINEDDQKKVITIETDDDAKGQTIELDEKKKTIKITDVNKNEVLLDDKGISLKTDSSKGNKIVIDAGQQGTIEMKAGKISLKAATDLKAESDSMATLSANNTTTIKGSTAVMIN